MAINNRQQPDYYADLFDAMVQVPDPILMRDRVPQDGLEHKDSWGTTCVFPLDAPGKEPRVTNENAVVKDVTKWREQVVVPTVKGLDWSRAEAIANAVNREEKFVGFLSACGLFERSHFLMGMENAFIAYLEEPEAMAEMLRVIADFKIESIKEDCIAYPTGHHLVPR